MPDRIVTITSIAVNMFHGNADRDENETGCSGFVYAEEIYSLESLLRSGGQGYDHTGASRVPIVEPDSTAVVKNDALAYNQPQT